MMYMVLSHRLVLVASSENMTSLLLLLVYGAILLHIRGSSVELALEARDIMVDDGGVLQQNRSEDVCVEDRGTVKLGEDEPEDKDGLEEKVEWKPIKDYVGKVFQNVDKAKDDPVTISKDVRISKTYQ